MAVKYKVTNVPVLFVPEEGVMKLLRTLEKISEHAKQFPEKEKDHAWAGGSIMSNKKLAVILPGIGYTADRSLLYFTGKLAMNNGYEVFRVPFSGFEKGIKGNPEKMKKAFFHALQQTEDALSDFDFNGYKDILFISKSIGTAAAAAYEQKHFVYAGNIYYTPLKETYEFINKDGLGSDGIAFHGTADPWAPNADIEEESRRTGVPLRIIKDANHSLETGNVDLDVCNLRNILTAAKEYLTKRIET